MPKAVRKEPKNYGKDALAVLLLAAAVFIVICLVSYHPADPALNSASNVKNINNLGGVIGAFIYVTKRERNKKVFHDKLSGVK